MSKDQLLDNAAQAICAKHNYKFVAPLGQGAFKKAYRISTETGDGALKLAHVVDDGDRLLREVEALKKCTHKNIASLLAAEIIEHEGQPILAVMEEYLGGGTLLDQMSQGPLPKTELANLGKTLADILNHLYPLRIVHRDIKPANIIYRDGSDLPVLTDFGIARMLDEPSLTKTFLAMGPGTPAYAAPEQLNNDKEIIDWRTDQFQAALLVAECHLGRHAFQQLGESVQAGIMRVAARNSIPEENAHELEFAGLGFLLKALGSWPVQRYRYPADFLGNF